MLLHHRLVVDGGVNIIESLTEFWHEELWLVGVKPQNKAFIVTLILLEGSFCSGRMADGVTVLKVLTEVKNLSAYFFLLAIDVHVDGWLVGNCCSCSGGGWFRIVVGVNRSFERQYGGFLGWLWCKMGGEGVGGVGIRIGGCRVRWTGRAATSLGSRHGYLFRCCCGLLSRRGWFDVRCDEVMSDG